jgi:hypothetical protein
MSQLQYISPGDDDMGEDLIGQVVRQVVRQARGRGAAIPGRNVFRQPPLPAAPAQGNVSELRSYMGFGFLTWTGAADSADKTLTIEPQESFRGERLIIALAVAGGAAAGLTTLRRIEVGTLPQSPSVEAPAPAAMFSPDATESKLDLQIAYRGTKLAITLGQTASPGAGVTVTAAVGMYGQWIR